MWELRDRPSHLVVVWIDRGRCFFVSFCSRVFSVLREQDPGSGFGLVRKHLLLVCFIWLLLRLIEISQASGFGEVIATIITALRLTLRKERQLRGFLR